MDPGSEWLAKAFAFHANAPGRAELPTHASLFAHLQPAHVQPYLIETWPDVASPDDAPLRATSEGDEALAAPTTVPMEPPPPPPPQTPETEAHPDVAEQFQNTAVVPAWVAASERFVDSGVAELLNSGASSTMSVPEKQAYQDGAARALSEVRQLVARHAGKS
jgi:hypothetical protein